MDASAFDRAGCEPGNDPLLEDRRVINGKVIVTRAALIVPMGTWNWHEPGSVRRLGASG